MKTPLLLLIALLLAIGIIYRAGNLIPAATPRRATAATVQHAPSAQLPVPDAVLTADQARQLTSEQRLERLRKAAAIEGDTVQAASLLPLIEALTKEELPAATTLLRDIRKDTDSIIQSNWDALALQWGRLDPIGFSPFFKDDLFVRRDFDPHVVMQGWLETDPTAAIAWAQNRKANYLETLMATTAIIHSAYGDPQQLAAAIQAFPAEDGRIPSCLLGYFDLVGKTTGNTNLAVIYENMPPALRKVAWSAVMGSLAETDPQAAVDWLNAHVHDPGRNYAAACRLMNRLSDEDPAGTAQWAATFPDDIDDNDSPNPACAATFNWLEKDPVAAKAWLQTQSPTLHWVRTVLSEIHREKDSAPPAAAAVEN